MSFSDRLSEVIHGSGLSQKAAASKLGVTQQAINNWINGTANPTEFNLGKICREFRIRRDWLLHGEGSRDLEALRVHEEPVDYAQRSRVQNGVDVVIANSTPVELQLFEGLVKTFGSHVIDQRAIERHDERNRVSEIMEEKEK